MGRQSKRMALCGLLAALAVTVLVLGGVIPAAMFCAPMLAMVAQVPILEEYGRRTAATAYGAVSLLALLLVSDRETALVYVCFGWYPLLRPKIARLPALPLRLVCRTGVFAAVTAVLYGAVMTLLGLGETETPEAPWLTAAALAAGWITFLLLDLCLARMTALWRRTLRRRLFRGKQ